MQCLGIYGDIEDSEVVGNRIESPPSGVATKLILMLKVLVVG